MTATTANDSNNNAIGMNAFGRLAPAVSVGGNPLEQGGQGGSSRYSYDLENGAGAGAGTEDMVEHNYGDMGNTEVISWCWELVSLLTLWA